MPARSHAPRGVKATAVMTHAAMPAAIRSAVQ